MARQRVLTIILAGGSGGRLKSLTENRAKPAVPFMGTYRLIDFALSNCMHSGLSDVWVVEQYLPHSLNDHLANGRPWDLDRSYGGLQVLPPYQGADRDGFADGNADALHRQLPFIRDFSPEIVVVLSADHIYKLDYRVVIDQHLESGAELTMVVKEMPEGEDVSRYGVVELEGDRITGFEYKPENPKSHTVATEVFVYDAGVLVETLERLAKKGALEDYGDHLVPDLVERGTAKAFQLKGYWRDVGTVESYWLSHQELLRDSAELKLDDAAWPILSLGTQRPPACVTAGANVEGSVLSPGSRTSGIVHGSVIGPGVVVEEGAMVVDSILLEQVVVASGVTVRRAVVDSGVHMTEDLIGEAEIALSRTGPRRSLRGRHRPLAAPAEGAI